jgi:hypothetical protein
MTFFVFAVTVSALANPVQATFTGLGGASQNGEYVYPYFISIDNGPSLAMICDDFYHGSAVGDTWQANITNLTSGDLGNTRFNDLAEYEQAGYLLMQINDGNQQEWGNINFAVWKIFSPSVDMGPIPPGTLGPEYWYDLALSANLSNIDFSGVNIVTPVGAHDQGGDQEFIFVTPEPGTLLLIGTGFIGLFFTAQAPCITDNRDGQTIPVCPPAPLPDKYGGHPQEENPLTQPVIVLHVPRFSLPPVLSLSKPFQTPLTLESVRLG